jgi:hypothetical protein
VAHKVCHEVGSWVESHVQQQVEQCIEQDCKWWCACCNKWLCALVWVVVNVVSWVVQTVCEIVGDVLDFIGNVLRGAWDILAGIFTGDWSRVLAGLLEAFGGAVVFVLQMASIVTLGTLIGAFETSINAWKLRDYARGLLQGKYGKDPDTFQQISDALGLESGGFGLRLKVTASRLFVRSDVSTQPDGTPDLFVWVRDNHLDLKPLAGFNPQRPWWSRQWPELVGDADDVTDTDLDTYVIEKGVGERVKHFSLFGMSEGDMQTRLDCAEQHAPEIGLILQTSIKDTRVESFDQIAVDRGNIQNILPDPPFNRAKVAADPAGATAEICKPVTIGVFDFVQADAMGESRWLAGFSCLEPGANGSATNPARGITGCFFRNRKPDLVFKYTAAHELGHTFGLCHVDGLLRIMWSPISTTTWATFNVIWHWYTSGSEARFTLDEGKRVWDYIVANASVQDLMTRQF